MFKVNNTDTRTSIIWNRKLFSQKIPSLRFRRVYRVYRTMHKFSLVIKHKGLISKRRQQENKVTATGIEPTNTYFIILRALFSCYLPFAICPFALWPTSYSIHQHFGKIRHERLSLLAFSLLCCHMVACLFGKVPNLKY